MPDEAYSQEDQNKILSMLLRMERLEERLRAREHDLDNLNRGLEKTACRIEREVTTLADRMSKEYVKKIDFDPVKKLVYTFVIAAVLALGGVMLSVVKTNIHQPVVVQETR